MAEGTAQAPGACGGGRSMHSVGAAPPPSCIFFSAASLSLPSAHGASQPLSLLSRALLRSPTTRRLRPSDGRHEDAALAAGAGGAAPTTALAACAAPPLSEDDAARLRIAVKEALSYRRLYTASEVAAVAASRERDVATKALASARADVELYARRAHPAETTIARLQARIAELEGFLRHRVGGTDGGVGGDGVRQALVRLSQEHAAGVVAAAAAATTPRAGAGGGSGSACKAGAPHHRSTTLPLPAMEEGVEEEEEEEGVDAAGRGHGAPTAPAPPGVTPPPKRARTSVGEEDGQDGGGAGAADRGAQR